MDGAFIAKFVFESKINAKETTITKNLMQKQTYKTQNRRNNKTKQQEKTKLKQSAGVKSQCKKGSHEWLKQTFIGEERGDNNSDDELL